MRRLFLSAPTTCALLLGAGLLLRAHAALRFDTPAAGEARVHALRQGLRPSPLDMVQRPAAGSLQGRQGPARRATVGVQREQPGSHVGKRMTAKARRAAARRRAHARAVEVRRAAEAGKVSQGGQQ